MRRPGYAILDAVFKVFSSTNLDVGKYMPLQARIELFLLSCVSMQLETNLRADVCDLIGVTDASEKAGGMCRDRYVGLLEAGQEKPEGLCYHISHGDQRLDVEIGGGLVNRDNLIGLLLDPKLVREAWQK